MGRPVGRSAAGSRDSHLTLRRVERQQHLIERLHATGERITLGRLAADLGVTERTIARDIERLRHSGVPISVMPGRAGGATIERSSATRPVDLDLPEIAALMASLAALGPTASESSASAMRKLAAALVPSNLDARLDRVETCGSTTVPVPVSGEAGRRPQR